MIKKHLLPLIIDFRKDFIYKIKLINLTCTTKSIEI